MSRKIVTYVLAAISALLAFQAYGNSKLSSVTREKATTIACSVKECSEFEPVAERSNIVSHQYEFATKFGPQIATCRRALIFFGGWKCSETLEAGRIGLDRRY